MHYIVDRIENNIAVLENTSTKNILEINIYKLPRNIKEGTVIIYSNNKYQIDLEEEKRRKMRIQEKFNKLKK